MGACPNFQQGKKKNYKTPQTISLIPIHFLRQFVDDPTQSGWHLIVGKTSVFLG
jgi:hypothetical protein